MAVQRYWLNILKKRRGDVVCPFFDDVKISKKTKNKCKWVDECDGGLFSCKYLKTQQTTNE